MSLPMLRRAALDLRWTVFWYALGMVSYTLLISLFWPTAKRNSDLFSQYISQLPDAFVRAFGINDMAHIEGFLGGELLNFMWPLIASVFLITAGSALVAGEIDRGTVEVWLSVPASRWRLLSAKLAALLLGILGLVLATVAAMVVGARLVDESFSGSGLIASGVALGSFCVAVGGYSALFSSVIGRRAAAAGAAAAVTIGSYLLMVISGLSSDWEWLKYLSFVSAHHPQQALASGRVDPGEVGALIAVGLVCALLSLVVFERRDVAP